MDSKKIENIKSQDFGIEIEVEGVSRNVIAEAIASYFEKPAKKIDCSTWRIKDESGRFWICTCDGSLAGGGCEIISPICYYKDIKIIEDIIDILKGLGAEVNYRTGIHIHIGAHKMSANQLRNLVNSFSSHEDMVFKALKVDNAREEEYCRKTNFKFLKKLNKDKPDSKKGLFDIWYEILSPDDNNEEGRCYHYNVSRYYAVNLHATYTKGTVEFRMFNSILEKEKVASYIIFCMALIAQAIEAKRVSFKKVISDNEKFSMRTWLRQLGLNGNEFKVCRHTFLENLTGDLANR